MEQLDVQQNKGKDMHTAHIQEGAKTRSFTVFIYMHLTLISLILST